MKPLEPLALPLFGVQLIEASAGTGKTYTITTLYLRLLLERGLSVEQILVVTFTEAATFELRSRIRKRLRMTFEAVEALESGRVCEDPELLQIVSSLKLSECKKRLRVALASFDVAQILTIHGFCQRVLSEFAFESGVRFDLELSADLRHLLIELVQDFWSSELFSASEAEVRYLQQHHANLSDLFHVARIATSFPNLEVVPAATETPDPTSLAEFIQARSQFAAVWERERENVQRILLTSEALNRNRYKESTVAAWPGQLDILSRQQGETLHGWFPRIESLTPKGLAEGTKVRQVVPENPAFFALESLCDAHAQVERDLEVWRLGLIGRLVEFVRREFPKRKEKNGVQSFDDLLNQLSHAVSEDKRGQLARSLRDRYPAALIDEFQDTDPTQYGIFRHIYAPGQGSLFLIGDPKQAIYAFRGADIFAYLKAAADAAPHTFTLTTNYRSDPGLVAAVNGLFEAVNNPFIYEGIRYVGVTARPGASDSLTEGDVRLAPLEIQFFPRDAWLPKSAKQSQKISKLWAETTLPGLIAGEIEGALRRGGKIGGRPIVPGDIAVLTRTNRQALLVQAALRKLRVPSVLQCDASVLDSPEARELTFVLRAMAEPNSQRALRVALMTTLLGQSADDLWALEEHEEGWERWVEDFYRWNETWQRRGVYQALRQLLHEQRAHERVLSLVDGERRLTNLLHLAELLHHEACARHLGINGTLQWFDEMRHDKGAREGLAPQAQQIRLESDARAVQLTTLHRSKGLEYPIVYCPYLWDGALHIKKDLPHLLYHDPDDDYRMKLDVRDPLLKDSLKKVVEQERVAENLRLLYVGLTRAKHRVVVTWGAFAEAHESAVGYLLHSPRGDFLATPESVAARLKESSDSEMLEQLRTLERSSLGNFAVSEVRQGSLSEYVPLEAADDLTGARAFSRTMSTSFRSSSFSGLTQASWTESSQGNDPGRDWDEGTPATSALGVTSQGAVPITLELFPRGAATGTLVHSILEQLNFEQASASEVGSVVDRLLRLHGLSVSQHGALLSRGLAEILETPLLAGSGSSRALSLSQVGPHQRLNELEFTLPVVGPEGQDWLTPQRLASALEAAGSEGGAVPKDYPSSLSRLRFVPLQGFLRGFIDLVFEHEGLFYLVDYKSNFLGAKYQDYDIEALKGVMAGHHYFLQYHLYTVALHRYLNQRIKNYSYDAHFGGVFYLFLRGMTPRNGPKTGVFFDRPSHHVVSALDGLFGPMVAPLIRGTT